MKLILPCSAAILVATVGFFIGRSAGSTTLRHSPAAVTPPRDNSEKAVARPPAQVPDSPALTQAYEILLGQERYHSYAAFHGAVQQLDLEQVSELHRRIVATPDNDAFLDAVADRWVQLDPASIADFVRTFPNGAGVIDRTGLVFAWARRSPEAAIAEAVRNGASSKSTLLLKGAFGTLAAKDPESAVSKLGLIADEKQRNTVFESCLFTWAHDDPVAATKWMQTHPDAYGVGTEGNETVANFTRRVARRDLTTALEFTRHLNEPLRRQATLATASEWACNDPAAALTWCRENKLPVDEVSTGSSGAVLTAAMLRGPDKTVNWVESLPPGEERGDLAAYALRNANAGVAPRLFALIPEEDQPNHVARYMKSLNNQRVGAALQYATSLPEGKLRVAALGTLINDYRFTNPVQIIDAFTAGPSRDVAYAAHIEKSMENGKTAPDVEQLGKIDDAAYRQRVAVGAYRSWRRTDAAAAQKWLDSTPHIPAEWKPRLVPGPQPPR